MEAGFPSFKHSLFGHFFSLHMFLRGRRLVLSLWSSMYTSRRSPCVIYSYIFIVISIITYVQIEDDTFIARQPGHPGNIYALTTHSLSGTSKALAKSKSSTCTLFSRHTRARHVTLKNVHSCPSQPGLRTRVVDLFTVYKLTSTVIITS